MLSLYRRHSRTGDCPAGYEKDFRSYESDERRKGWKRCSCPIYASGTLGGIFKRRNTRCSTWEEAKQVAASWESAQSWDAHATRIANASSITEADIPAGMAIADSVSHFLTSRRKREIADSTYRKYTAFGKQFLAYTESKGYAYMSQLTVADMDRFYASWTDGPKSRAKKLERLKGFVKFCLKRKWVSENIAEDLEPPSGVSGGANKSPFTDDELKRIFAACDILGGPTPPGPGHRDWSGEDVRQFILLAIYTGLRISDLAQFNVHKRLDGNSVFLRMHKTKKPLSTWVPDWLRDMLQQTAAKLGPEIFILGYSRRVETMAELWRVKLKRVFATAAKIKPFDEKPTPHRFRHTFVRLLLEKGVPASDVAELIGDTEDTVLRHYARWVPERQERLTAILREKLSAPQDAFAVP
jgi:integrase